MTGVPSSTSSGTAEHPGAPVPARPACGRPRLRRPPLISPRRHRSSTAAHPPMTGMLRPASRAVSAARPGAISRTARRRHSDGAGSPARRRPPSSSLRLPAGGADEHPRSARLPAGPWPAGRAHRGLAGQPPGSQPLDAVAGAVAPGRRPPRAGLSVARPTSRVHPVAARRAAAPALDWDTPTCSWVPPQPCRPGSRCCCPNGTPNCPSPACVAGCRR